jgi:hypothetical protein
MVARDQVSQRASSSTRRLQFRAHYTLISVAVARWTGGGARRGDAPLCIITRLALAGWLAGWLAGGIPAASPPSLPLTLHYFHLIHANRYDNPSIKVAAPRHAAPLVKNAAEITS